LVVKTSFGSAGSAAAAVKVYAPAVCDHPAARAGKVVEGTPDSGSFEAAATLKPPAAPVRKKTVPPPLSYAFVSDENVSDGVVGFVVSTLTVALAAEVPWLATLSEIL